MVINFGQRKRRIAGLAQVPPSWSLRGLLGGTMMELQLALTLVMLALPELVSALDGSELDLFRQTRRP